MYHYIPFRQMGFNLIEGIGIPEKCHRHINCQAMKESLHFLFFTFFLNFPLQQSHAFFIDRVLALSPDQQSGIFG